MEDCSQISDSPRWQFVQSSSTDVAAIIEKSPLLKNGIDRMVSLPKTASLDILRRCRS